MDGGAICCRDCRVIIPLRHGHPLGSGEAGAESGLPALFLPFPGGRLSHSLPGPGCWCLLFLAPLGPAPPPAFAAMPLENLEEEGLPKNPDLRIAQLRFLLSLQPQRPDPAVRQELMAAIRQHGKPGRRIP